MKTTKKSKTIGGDSLMQRIGGIKFTAAIIGIGLFMACSDASAQSYTKPASLAPERSAKEVRGASPYIEIKNEPPPKLIVDEPLPDLLDQGVLWVQWRVENVNIAPIFGPGATQVSPRIGHLHVQVDNLPWWWADPSNVNTIDMAGLPPGKHKVKITLVNANHEEFPGQSKIVEFTIPESAKGGNCH